jgi:hypothetical protein
MKRKYITFITLSKTNFKQEQVKFFFTFIHSALLTNNALLDHKILKNLCWEYLILNTELLGFFVRPLYGVRKMNAQCGGCAYVSAYTIYETSERISKKFGVGGYIKVMVRICGPYTWNIKPNLNEAQRELPVDFPLNLLSCKTCVHNRYDYAVQRLIENFL